MFLYSVKPYFCIEFKHGDFCTVVLFLEPNPKTVILSFNFKELKSSASRSFISVEISIFIFDLGLNNFTEAATRKHRIKNLNIQSTLFSLKKFLIKPLELFL